MILETHPNIIATIITGTLLFGLLTVFIIYFILLYRKSQTKLYFERERRKQELLRAEIEIKEQTLVNVSREIHDNLGQAAALVKINLNLVSKELSASDQQKIDESRDLLKKLIGDMRSLSESLNGDNIRRKGFIEMIEMDVKRINNTGYVNVKFEHPKEKIALELDQLIILYRMIQELFTNTLKYAKATNVHLIVEQNQQKLSVNFRDNGIGFNYQTALNKGSGLTNIKERCEIIDAKLYFESELNKGVNVKITLDKPQNL